MKTLLVILAAFVLTCSAGLGEDIRNSQNRLLGKVENQRAYNEQNRLLGSYRDGKTYDAGNRLFGYGNLLSALVVLDAKDRGVWK